MIILLLWCCNLLTLCHVLMFGLDIHPTRYMDWLRKDITSNYLRSDLSVLKHNNQPDLSMRKLKKTAPKFFWHHMISNESTGLAKNHRKKQQEQPEHNQWKFLIYSHFHFISMKCIGIYILSLLICPCLAHILGIILLWQ